MSGMNEGEKVGRPSRRWIGAWIAGLLLIAVLGLAARSWMWEQTRPIRFNLDYENAYRWGSEVLHDARLIDPKDAPATALEGWQRFAQGYLGIYDRVSDEGSRRDRDYWLDYPPLRLLVMSLWTKSVREAHPDRQAPLETDVFPLLRLNTLVDVFSALVMFCLVRLWARRIAAAQGWPQWRVTLLAAGSAVLVWLNPAAIVITHGWPQWDSWLLAFYLLAMLAASSSRWFVCGLVLGVAALLKGQILIVSPFFILWALCSAGLPQAFRVLAGWVTGFVALVSPWLLAGLGQWALPVGLALAAVPVAWFAVRRRSSELPWVCVGVAAAVFSLGIVAGGSFAWYEVGFRYGSRRYLALFTGAVYNLPSLLDDNGWDIMDPVLSLGLHADEPVVVVTLRVALWIAYLVCVTLCALAITYHAKRGRPETLVALGAPCLAMFVWLAQMHERYLLWGAAMSAAAALLSPRLFVYYVLLALGSTGMVLTVMCRRVPEFAPPALLGFLDGVESWADIFYPVLIIGCFLWLLYQPALRVLSPLGARLRPVFDAVLLLARKGLSER